MVILESDSTTVVLKLTVNLLDWYGDVTVWEDPDNRVAYIAGKSVRILMDYLTIQLFKTESMLGYII